MNRQFLAEFRSAEKNLKAVEALFNEGKATMRQHHEAIERVEAVLLAEQGHRHAEGG